MRYKIISILIKMRYFISGHINLSEDDFAKHYILSIDKALEDNSSTFVIGDAYGVDLMANMYLHSKGISKERITIYHIGVSTYNKNPGQFLTKGGFKSHTEKDTAMTNDSDKDILYIRSIEEQKRIYGDNYKHRVSGTERNRNRRIKK